MDEASWSRIREYLSGHEKKGVEDILSFNSERRQDGYTRRMGISHVGLFPDHLLGVVLIECFQTSEAGKVISE